MTFSDAEPADITGDIGRPTNYPNWGLRLLGFVALVPAVYFGITTLVVPHVRTVIMSGQKYNVLTPPSFIGSANYDRLAEDPIYHGALSFTLALIIERVIVVAVLPIVLALAANALGRFARIGTRLLASIPLAFFAPVFIYISMVLVLRSPPQDQVQWLSDPQGAPAQLIITDFLVTVGLAGGFGVLVCLMALRGKSSWQKARIPLLVIWIVSVATAVASALQSFTMSYVMTRGGPANTTTPIMLYLFSQGFQFLNFGMGAAVATIVLNVLGVLGILTGLVVIAFGLRMEMVAENKPKAKRKSSTGNVLVVIVSVLVLIIGLYLVVGSIDPLVRVFTGEIGANTSGTSQPPDSLTLPNFLQSTTMPVLLGLLRSPLLVVVLAAFGIGALRPLGRYSEWLLLPFSPWLFVTTIPLSLAMYVQIKGQGILDTRAALQAGSTILQVPMLFILTLFFKGQERKFRAGEHSLGEFVRIVVLPVIPLVLLLLCIAVMFGQQDLYWPLLVSTSSDLQPVPVWLAAHYAQFAARSQSIGDYIRFYGIPLALVSFIILALFQISYVDRLALSTSDRE